MDLLHSPLFFFSFFLCSSLSAAQVSYFINCGSADNATLSDGRTFVGDENPRQFKFSGDRSKTLKNTNQSAEPLYQKARVFRTPSTYQFEVPENGTYILRFHFYSFSSSPELAGAQFNVSASGHLLLSDFSVPKNDSNTVKEFILTLKQNHPNLRIHFWPGNIAFVNAIEVISTSQNITEDNGPDVSPAGSRGVYNGQKSKVLETIYRINVGALDKTPYVDGVTNLWRTWIPDDPFLITKDEATNAPRYSLTGGSWEPGLATEYDAPDYVYETAKMFKVTKSSVSSNLTWQFKVSKGATYFVRAHFCDIISLQLGLYMFNMYFYTKFGQKIDPRNTTDKLAVPFYKDFIVESNDLDFVNVSIGPSNGSIDKSYMFLNGLEILQIKEGVAPDPSVSGGGSSHLGLIVGLVVGGVCIVAVLVGVLFVLRRKRRTKPAELFEGEIVSFNAGISSQNRTPDRSSSQVSSLSNLQLGLTIPFVEIQRVTSNFDPGLIIGEGGFGKVYRGTLKNGIEVAVKRSNPAHGQGLAEFQTEIMVLSKIRHCHLVSLIGYCYEGGEMILVYEFMEKGSLRDHLYNSRVKSGSSGGVGLSWKQRLEICIGAAKGLHYLHTGLDSGIIHRDVKSTNILLDRNYVAKVADFGLSRSQHLEKTHVSTEVKGTFGYLDPEYFSCLQLTEKSDVYSFGVLLLEVLCARPVIDRSLPRMQINLVDWARTCYKEGHLESIIDPSIASEISPNSLKKFVETADKCLKECAVERPQMADVLWDLEYALQLQKVVGLRNLPDDSMTDASVSLPFHVAQRLPSMSFVDDDEDENVLIGTHTG